MKLFVHRFKDNRQDIVTEFKHDARSLAEVTQDLYDQLMTSSRAVHSESSIAQMVS